MKRITVDLDEGLILKAMDRSGIKTKKELINTALKYYRDLLLREKEEAEKKKK